MSIRLAEFLDNHIVIACSSVPGPAFWHGAESVYRLQSARLRRVASKQRCTQLLLQCLDAGTDGRLGDMRSFGGTDEIAGRRDGEGAGKLDISPMIGESVVRWIDPTIPYRKVDIECQFISLDNNTRI